MKNLVFLISFLFSTVFLWSANPVPYSGKVAIRGVNYFGDAQFTFSLQDKDGKTHWRNGKSKDDSIKVNIRNGYYSVLLGGQGMNALPLLPRDTMDCRVGHSRSLLAMTKSVWLTTMGDPPTPCHREVLKARGDPQIHYKRSAISLYFA